MGAPRAGGKGAEDAVYDRVIIKELNGLSRTVSKPDYEKLSLRDRVVLLMSARVEFFLGDKFIPPKEAIRNR